MTIKITSVSAASGEIVLTIAYDNPRGSGNFFSYKLKKTELYQRLREIEELLGRAITLTDAQEALVAIINEVRTNKSSIPADFDFTQYLNTELEA